MIKNVDGLCCLYIITPIIILRNSENIWSEAGLRNVPLFTPSITDLTIHIWGKLVNQNFQGVFGKIVCGLHLQRVMIMSYQKLTTSGWKCVYQLYRKVIARKRFYSFFNFVCIQKFSPNSKVFYQRAYANLYYDLLGDLEEWKEFPRIKNPDARPILLERSRKLLYWAKET
jgi:hypothetical protein